VAREGAELVEGEQQAQVARGRRVVLPGAGGFEDRAASGISIVFQAIAYWYSPATCTAATRSSSSSISASIRDS